MISMAHVRLTFKILCLKIFENIYKLSGIDKYLLPKAIRVEKRSEARHQIKITSAFPTKNIGLAPSVLKFLNIV